MNPKKELICWDGLLMANSGPDFTNNESGGHLWVELLTCSVCQEQPQYGLWNSRTMPRLFTPSELTTSEEFLIPSLTCYHSAHGLWIALTNQNYTKCIFICTYVDIAKLHSWETSVTWDWPKWGPGSGKFPIKSDPSVALLEHTLGVYQMQRRPLPSLQAVVWIVSPFRLQCLVDVLAGHIVNK